MQLTVVDGNDAQPHPQCNLLSYVINRSLAVDAGAIGLMSPARQKEIKAVFLSHAHADHIATLPLFIENVFTPGPECVTLYASDDTLASLRRHVFNDQIWPDLERLAGGDSPFFKCQSICAGDVLQVGDLQVTPFDVDHTIPTLGFLIEEPETAIAIVSDTAPCDTIWEFLSDTPRLQAVFLEISFPDALAWLAEKSKHLTPSTFLAETRKLRREVQWYITHVKSEHAEQVGLEVASLGLASHYEFAIASRDYRF